MDREPDEVEVIDISFGWEENAAEPAPPPRPAPEQERVDSEMSTSIVLC